MTALVMSPNLALNELVARRREAGSPVLHMGFGEARLPVLAELAECLRAGPASNAYGDVAGSLAARTAAAGYFSRRRLATDPGQIVLGPGSKPLLMALNIAVPGTVLLPRPCWNSYAPQARMAGRRIVTVPIAGECGGVPDPQLLREAILVSRAAGEQVRTLVLTVPDNPTGTVAPPQLVRQVCSIAEEHDLVIVSDEIYREIVHDTATPVLSPAEVAPERTVVTTGLSKSLALGGWRIGAARFPVGRLGEVLRDRVLSVASDVWSTLAGPMQTVAGYAFDEPPEIRRRLAASGRLHGTVARDVHRSLVAAGAMCRPPTAGFYVYPDLEPLRAGLMARGVRDSETLCRLLLDELGIAVLGGHQLGDDPRALRFKAATSMLYGETVEQQEQSLHAADPIALPHVRDVLAQIRERFSTLAA